MIRCIQKLVCRIAHLKFCHPPLKMQQIFVQPYRCLNQNFMPHPRLHCPPLAINNYQVHSLEHSFYLYVTFGIEFYCASQGI